MEKRKAEDDIVDLVSSDEDGDEKQPKLAEYKPSFLQGKTYRTHLNGYTGNERGLMFEDLVAKDYLKKAVFCGYVIDHEWLLSMLDDSTNIVLIEKLPSNFTNETYFRVQKNILIVQPDKLNYGSMHAKLMLLWYPEFLRICIGSANITLNDWSEIENIVFVQDVLASEVPTLYHKNDFQKDLMSYLEALSVPEKVYNQLYDFDFSTVKVEIVSSVPGPCSEEIPNGVYDLKAKIKKLFPNINNVSNISVSYLVTVKVSSIGKTYVDYVQSFFNIIFPSKPNLEFKLLYPTYETMKNSTHGTNGGMTTFFNHQYFNDPEFPRSVLHDSLSLRDRAINHSKVMTGYLNFTTPTLFQGTGAQDNGTSSKSFYYCGSHNFSAAAWGSLFKPKSRSKFKSFTNEFATAYNFELGIITATPISYEFKGEFNVPFKTPLTKYKEYQLPWDPNHFKN